MMYAGSAGADRLLSNQKSSTVPTDPLTRPTFTERFHNNMTFAPTPKYITDCNLRQNSALNVLVLSLSCSASILHTFEPKSLSLLRFFFLQASFVERMLIDSSESKEDRASLLINSLQQLCFKIVQSFFVVSPSLNLSKISLKVEKL